MQLRKTLLVGLLSATMLSGCSWFSGETDTVVMAPLPQVENQFTPQTVWSRSVGTVSVIFTPTCVRRIKIIISMPPIVRGW